MSFLAPAWLWLAGFGLMVLILHARHRRTLQIPSVRLWLLAGSRDRLRPRFRMPRPNWLLGLQLAAVGLIALALARPVTGERFGHEIVVLDASGSMRQTDVAPSRFDAATALLSGMARGPVQESGARLSVILSGTRPQIIAARLAEPAGAVPLVAGRRAGDGGADWNAAAGLAAALVRDGEPTRLTVVTGVPDAAGPFVAALPGVTVATRAVRGASPRNAGLHATLRAVDAAAGKWRAEGTVTFQAAAAASTTVTALVQPEGSNGFLEWGTVAVSRQAGATTAGFRLDLDLRAPGSVVLRLPDDDGPADNAVQFVVHPRPAPLRILQLGPASEALARALKAAAEVTFFAADTLPADASGFDLVVINGIESARPATNTLWLGAAHAAGDAAGTPRRFAELNLPRLDHPLTASASWATIRPGRAYAFPRLPGATGLAETAGTTLIEARSTLTGREVRIGFDLDASDWPQQPGFPAFVTDLVGWIAPDARAVVETPCRVGQSCRIDPRLSGGTVARVVPQAEGVAPRPEGKEAAAEDSAAPVLPAAPRDTGFLPQGFDAQFIPDRAGVYRLTRGGLTRFVAVNTPDADAAAADGRETTPPDAANASAWDRVPLRTWIIIAVLGLLAAEAWIAGRSTERFLRLEALRHGNPLAARRRLLLGLRAAALLFVGLALASIPLPLPKRGPEIVLVAGPALGPATGAENTGLADPRPSGAGAPHPGLVTAAARTRVVADLGAEADAVSGPAETTAPAADLESALATAAAMLPPDEAGRIVVLGVSDTRGNAARVLPAIRRRGIPVDVVAGRGMPDGEVLVESVSAPDRIRAGDPFPLHAAIYSQAPVAATVRILRDGKPIAERQVELAAGRSRIETTMPAAEAGRARYEVTVAADHDVFPQNNRGVATVEVLPAPEVLIVAAQPAWAEPFGKALAVQEIKSRIVEPRRAPYYLKDLLPYAAIVLMNVPAIELSTLQQELIEKAVMEHGRGLMILGGENSFGPGGYYETALERVSPLSSRVPREAPRVALCFVLDRSGSMQRNEGGATRLDIAKQATLSAIRLLHPESVISIVAFDTEAKLLMRPGPAKDAAAVNAALAQLDPGGGTSLYPALVEALHQFEGVDAMAKHIVVMSDGLTQPGDFPGILKMISAQGISVSTVSIGEGADGAMLQDIARLGKGAFHATQDFKALPGILSQEALLLSGRPVEERQVVPQWVDRRPEFFGGMPDRMPALGGYVLTTRKPGADLHLAVEDAKQEQVPLLASWRYGNGRVAALTTHGAGAWTPAWQALPEYPLLWSQIVRHLSSGDGGVTARVTRHGDEITADVEIPGPDGMPREGLGVEATLVGTEPTGTGTESAAPLRLTEIAPGRYRGAFTPGAPGDFTLRLRADQASAEVPVSIGYPAAYDFLRADPERLAAIAAATGGRVLTDAREIFRDRGWRILWRDLWQVWVAAAFGLFMAELIIRHAPGLLGSWHRHKPGERAAEAA